MNKRLLLIIVIVLVLAVGVGWYLNTHKTDKEAGPPPAGMGGQAQSVSVVALEPEMINLIETLPGRISASKQSQVRPQVNGIIVERLFEEGAAVKKGQQLYQIDAARYQAALASAEADLKSALSNVASIEGRTERYEDLVEINAVSRQEYEDAQAQVDQAKAAVAVAEAAVEVARVNFDYTKVYAPISGRIGRSLVTEGALVTANQPQPLAVITQLDPVYVDMQLSAVEAMSFQPQMENRDEISVTVHVNRHGAQPYFLEGKLKFSEVTINETTGSVVLRAQVPNPDAKLLPGLFVTATLDLGQKKVLLIPQRATTRMPDGSLTAWVVDNNKAQSVPIEVSSAHEDSWIVTGGLKPGDSVVVEGYQKLAPDAEVEPTPWQKVAAQTTDRNQE